MFLRLVNRLCEDRRGSCPPSWEPRTATKLGETTYKLLSERTANKWFFFLNYGPEIDQSPSF